MANITKSFTKGKMNKSTDVRLMQDGEYIDALNVRVNSTEGNNVGSIENSLGNLPLTSLKYIDGTPLSANARCIGAFEDGANERLFWFVHDPTFTVGASGKLDLIVSFDTKNSFLNYHVVSILNNIGAGIITTLNFNPEYLITGVSLVENLLFFTDDYNAPRRIDVDNSYSFPVANIDTFSDESLLVIKKPPLTSPLVGLIDIGNDINYMEDRFICFGYRYRYANNEYSATSQFSQPAFEPKDFFLSAESVLNEGMENKFNAAIITFQTGGDLVVGIDLLFKDANDPVIRVIEKLDKVKNGWGSNQSRTYTFDNSKIYTILPSSEILRLYDNVPRFAKAQTIMSNRLVYGNYTDGYDLIDVSGNNLKLDYYTELITTSISNGYTFPYTKRFTNYNIDPAPGTVVYYKGIVDFDLSVLNPSAGVNYMVAGSSISFDITFLRAYSSGTIPITASSSFKVSLLFTLPRSYTSVYDLASSSAFLDKVGTTLNILPVYDPTNPTSCSGTTFTDIYNCKSPILATLTKYASGITANGQPIEVFSSPSSNFISFKFPAIQYVADVNNPTGVYAYEYYGVHEAEGAYSTGGFSKSLHSNRGYEIAIAYMDDFNRSTTALVSNRNTEHVPCEYSDSKNSIKVTIPIIQKPPYWATRYKFLIKPDKQGYETIYAQFYWVEDGTNNIYFLLEGENARKVEEGDRYTVKSDSGGAINDCVTATVLEKKAQQKNFITTTTGVDVPSGVYMKITSDDFSAQIIPSAVHSVSNFTNANQQGNHCFTQLRCSTFNGTTHTDIAIPINSIIKIKFNYNRRGSSNRCEQRTFTYDETFTSTADYNNMYDWFVGDSISSSFVRGTGFAGAFQCIPNNVFYPAIHTTSPATPSLCTNNWYFYRGSTGYLELVITGTVACGSNNKKQVNGQASLQIYLPESSLIFETQPLDALPDVFYESSESFPITTGLHQGNVQNQTNLQSAIIDTDFYNCYTFGNGAESYKALDSITGKQFNLGNRVLSVSAEDYKEAHRFADLTYSGVYNDETNVNKLNEFNLGLLNFKPLEDSFGKIQILDGKQTNVLVLQEDKISYVLAGKNILSDAGGGSALTSIPQVLGQQVTKTEEYGISQNPESYVKWGYDKFFTDAKRGAVIQMKGADEAAGDQVKVISEQGMRSWFRDLFINDFNTQKLGGFDPYMNEYVLSSNDVLLPAEVKCLDCDDYRTFNVQSGNDYTYCINVGTIVGYTDVKWNIPAGMVGTVTINVVYNSITYTSGPVSVNGNISIPKSLTGETKFDITVISTGVATGLEVVTGCPDPNNINVRWIVYSPNPGSPILTPTRLGFSYVDGIVESPVSSTDVPFVTYAGNPTLSLYDEFTGPQGASSIPTDNSDITLFVEKNSNSSFNFDVNTNRFMYLRSSQVYENNSTDMMSLLQNASVALNPVETNEFVSATFMMPGEGNVDENLYLIWDLRDKSSLLLSYSTVDAADACCGYDCTELCSEYEILNNSGGVVLYDYLDCATGLAAEGTISNGRVEAICSRSIPTTTDVVEGVTITYTRCGCSS